jgi:nicotinamidase-related amidase
MAGAAFRTARIELPKTAFFLCDMQERFRTAIANFDLITNTSARMLKAASILDVPVFTTEQNPKGASLLHHHTIQYKPTRY